MLRLRRLAALTRVALALACLLAAPAGASAADPTTPPQPPAPTCAERFPEEGPAGVDLRLGCIVSELVGLYTPGQTAAPPAISTYALVVIAVALGAVILAAASTRLLARRAGTALAPVTPSAWWQCPTCRSINGAGVTLCYSCGLPRPPEVAVTIATDDSPGTPQTFGRGKHG